MVKGAARTHVVDRGGQQALSADKPTRPISNSLGLQTSLHDHRFKTPDHFGGKQGLTPVTCAAMLSVATVSLVCLQV